MPARFQLVVDCKDPGQLPASGQLPGGYVLEPPPEGFATWDDWRRDIGLPGRELGTGADSIIDPRGDGPRIWFHVMPDAKVVKNRLHIDIHASTDGPYASSIRHIPLEARKQRVDAEARRLTDLGATLAGALNADGPITTRWGCRTPRATSSTSTDASARRGSLCRSCYCSAPTCQVSSRPPRPR
jgi:hypothetical protein